MSVVFVHHVYLVISLVAGAQDREAERISERGVSLYVLERIDEPCWLGTTLQTSLSIQTELQFGSADQLAHEDEVGAFFAGCPIIRLCW